MDQRKHIMKQAIKIQKGINALNNFGSQIQNNYYTQFEFKPLNINKAIEFYVVHSGSTNYLFVIGLALSLFISPLIVSYGMLYFSQFGFGYANNYWLYFFTNLIILFFLTWIVIFILLQKKSKKLKLQLLEDKIIYDKLEVEYKEIRSFVKLTNLGFFTNYTFYIYKIDKIKPILEFDIQSQFNNKYKALHYALALEELLKNKISATIK